MRKTLQKSTYIFPRPNDIETEWYFDDVNDVVCEKTKDLIDGFCVPKVNSKEDMEKINDSMDKLESRLSLKKGTYKLIVQIETTVGFITIDKIIDSSNLLLIKLNREILWYANHWILKQVHSMLRSFQKEVNMFKLCLNLHQKVLKMLIIGIHAKTET